MLWVRNGCVELTIILNHKNIQYMFTLPFLHTLPIIITNKETAFSDLVIFGWLLWGIDLFTKLSGKEERFEIGSVCCHFKRYNFKHKAKSPDELNFRHLRSQVGSPFCGAYMRACTPSAITQRGCSEQQHLQSLLGRGQGLWKGTGWDCGEDVPGADCSGEEKHSGSGQGTVHCCVAPGMQGDWWKEQWRSSHSQAYVQSGWERGDG